MKKMFLILIVFLSIASCKKEDEFVPFEIPPPANVLVGTTWEANDVVANVIYGRGCKSKIYFSSASRFSETKYGDSRRTIVGYGSYKITGNNILMDFEDVGELNFYKSGDVINTDISFGGSELTYYKQD